MTLAEAVLLGVVQGLTEFLPISSSGHLVIMQHFLDFQEPPLTFDVLLHLGTVLAVIAAFWTEIVDIVRRPTQRLVIMILVASVPTGLIGILFKPIFEGFFASLTVVAIGLLVTGILIWLAEHLSFGFKTVREMTMVDALIIGTIQGVAITPGISRSGSTIAAGLFTGLDRELAARFSFLLSIPAVLGATLLEGRHLVGGQLEVDLLPLIIGPLVAAITGFMATKIVINLVKTGRLSIFSYYCWLVAFLILAQQIFF